MKQIFVRGLSRSGGTLMVTVLDAHPHVAMSYEIYEHLLAPSEEASAPDKLELLCGAKTKRTLLFKKSASKVEDKQLQTFISRAQRSGIEPETLAEFARQHQSKGLGFGTFRERMLFIELITTEKMHRQGKQHWGTKSDSSYEDLLQMYPGAYFLFMQRDGRDMASSRKLVGNFSQTVEHIAETWLQQVTRFQKFAKRPGVQARMVNYERLTSEPEQELRGIMQFLGLPWDDRLLNFHDEDLTIYQNPMGHLSAEQINKPINSSSVGRWKRDLTADEIAAFESIAGSLLLELGYETSQPATI
jgi:hypothetical protein